jgi:hypothetical protein
MSSWRQLYQRWRGKAEVDAQMLQKQHGLTGVWMIASPVHWEATHNDAMICYAGATLNLSDEASRRLLMMFADFIAEDNIRLHYHDATTWLLQAEGRQAPKALPVSQLLNQSIKPALHALEETPYWLRFMTEAQMFFSAQSSIVNGLWVWGTEPRVSRFKRFLSGLRG